MLSDEYVSSLPPPNRACDFHRTRLSIRQSNCVCPPTQLPLHFTDIHRRFLRVDIRLHLLRKTRRTATLRRVRGFPARGLLWSLRHSSRTSEDCSHWHFVMSLPRSQDQTLRGHLGSDSQSNPSRSSRYPEWKPADPGSPGFILWTEDCHLLQSRQPVR